jgi:hypothetical protein
LLHKGRAVKVALISTYELGRQPFGLASPVAWLREAGAEVVCLDVAVQELNPALVEGAGLVALYLPMHTATRLAVALIPRLRALAPAAHHCAYGLYAPANAELLHSLGIQTIIGGEFEAELTQLYHTLNKHDQTHAPTSTHTQNHSRKFAQFADQSSQQSAQSPQSADRSVISLERLPFRVPDRAGLPPLSSYARLTFPSGEQRTVGATEATRGCKHLCRHCPVVPVYRGRFRTVPHEVVLADVRRQVAAGAQHITFGDPDFFNGPGHALRIVRAMHAEHPALTYDVTIKVEHLLAHARHLAELRETGCVLVTSAVEAVDDAVLAIFDKRHTRADFLQAATLLREAGLTLSPTFVTFTPWTTRDGYRDLLRTVRDLGLVDHVAPVQYAIRLLIPAGSLLLELEDVRRLVGSFDRQALCFRWAHPDPAMDALHAAVTRAVHHGQQDGCDRRAIFAQIWELAGGDAAEGAGWRNAPRALVPAMSEPWYC